MSRRRAAGHWLLAGGLVGSSFGAEATGQESPATHVLIVTGVGGEPKYSAAFVSQAEQLIKGLAQVGVSPGAVTWLAEDPARAPGRVAGRSTRETVLAELSRLGARTGSSDRVLVVLIGHGSDAGEPRFNLPGPDLSAKDLAEALDRLGARPVAVINAASASGGFVDVVASDHRVVVTATRTGFERNETIFAEVLPGAFLGDAADIDKDGALSLLEAFTYASREVARRYENENRLLTEHARVSDEAQARRFVFTARDAALGAAPGDSVTTALLEKKRDLEDRIERLRTRKAGMDSTTYERELESLLLDLARTNQALRARGRSP